MSRVKAIFDADILIHLVKTNAIDFAINTIDYIYISEWVYENEIKKTTAEGKTIKKLNNVGKIKILKYDKLTSHQKIVFKETYKLLKDKNTSTNHDDNFINEGERSTASFAKALNIYYYMSDDNRAAPHIRSLAAIDIINYCDILFIYLYAYGNIAEKDKLEKCYQNYIKLYDANKIPKILRNKDTTYTFIEIIGRCFSRFEQTPNLKKFLDDVKENINRKLAVDE
ncbi:hypothetical protein [Clostridium taeniosporum]|uniref:Uncharacterized protein n=1 Tax=Clostridium taeniosporum TaxID=394958 RepID=A0A1D7XP63_9CLOT|nr:hypothetical protein [Clostridium taeniosporum]AOR24990.1 hypothetical protein BGI42_14685 [Clostridium taeniosporum]